MPTPGLIPSTPCPQRGNLRALYQVIPVQGLPGFCQPPSLLAGGCLCVCVRTHTRLAQAQRGGRGGVPSSLIQGLYPNSRQGLELFPRVLLLAWHHRPELCFHFSEKSETEVGGIHFRSFSYGAEGRGVALGGVGRSLFCGCGGLWQNSHRGLSLTPGKSGTRTSPDFSQPDLSQDFVLKHPTLHISIPSCQRVKWRSPWT